MSNINNSNQSQHLSDLLDDCVCDEAIEQLLNDSEQPDAWYRYQTVSAVIKKQHSAYSSFQFTKDISTQIAEEPAILCRPKRNFSDWKKATSGFAIAASVAFATVFSVQMTNTADQSTPSDVQFADLPTHSQTPSLADNLIDSAEQAKLDAIQNVLDRMNQRNLDAKEQLVGGDPMMIQSYIVQTNELTQTNALKTNNISPFEQAVRNMKKPSAQSQN